MTAHRTKRIYLSSPHLGGTEKRFLEEALDSNWIAPLGPQVDALEEEFCSYLDMEAAVALVSGTAAVHLGLRLVGVQQGDKVLCSTLTFVASANPILYLQANPVFVDADRASWNLDPNLLEDELARTDRSGHKPRAVVVADILGQSADWDAIESICARYGVEVVEDAAESLGATYQGQRVGCFGKCAAFSFNGNKIITTSGGGMLASKDQDLISRARFLAAQAREQAPHYRHSTLGYNYRMSNLLAAVGRAQLSVLEERVEQRRSVFEFYRSHLEDLPGLEFMPEANYGRSTRWITCVLVDPELFGVTRGEIGQALEKENVESRPAWMPLHMQPLFNGCRIVGGSTSEEIFRKGLFLPSSSSLKLPELEKVVGVIRKTCPAVSKHV